MKRIPLTRGLEAIVDDEDYERLIQYEWNAVKPHRVAYAIGRQGRMHRFILGVLPGLDVDHINGNGLDNRRCNLRICSASSNQANVAQRVTARTSRFKGVSFKTSAGCWFSQIQFEKRKITLGYFDDEEDAALAYNREAARLFGTFARLNDISIAEYRKGPRAKAYLGEANPAAKLSQDQAEQIRRSRLTSRELAEMHGVSVSTINRVRSGLRWLARAREGATA